MLSRLLAAGASLAVLVLSRYLLLSISPADDWRRVVSWARGIPRWMRRQYTWALSQVGYTELVWRRLRRQFQAGAYGEHGT